MVLGDRFPSSVKQRFIRKNLGPGAVLRLHCDFTTPPKPKFLVICCLQPQFLVFVVNTHIHPYIRDRKWLEVCQVCLDAANHNFLDHDSYIDCRNAIDDFSLGDIEALMLNDMQVYQGVISDDVRNQTLAAVKACTVLPRREKEWIIAALS